MTIPVASMLSTFAVTAVLAVTLIAYDLLARQKDPRRRLAILSLGGSIFFFVAVGYYVMHIVPRTGFKLDEYAYRADLIFGEPSFVIGRFLAVHSYLKTTATIAYFSLQTALTLAGVAYILSAPYDDGVRSIKIILLNFFMATPVFLLFPVTGPAYAFSGFPWIYPHVVGPHAVYFDGIPNGMPSIHTSTALLILYFARRWKIGAVLASAYLALIVLSTLGFGEHYLIDLIAAVPYTAGIIWGVKRYEMHQMQRRSMAQASSATPIYTGAARDSV